MQVKSVYPVHCFHCGKPFDAVKAADCDCVKRPRSLCCPHCQRCFCDAPPKYKTAFWPKAPRELWLRRNAPLDAGPAGATAKELLRPLVLFADDDAVGRTLAEGVIAEMGLGVIVARNGDEALDMARIHKPDLLITDAFMPKRDGREVARIVKKELPATKVIVITALYKNPRYRQEALTQFKVDEYLTKPVDPKQLRAVVEKQLGIRGVRDS
jgi:CheY-like chemotaxis protein